MVRSCCSSRGCLSEGMQILTIGDAGGWSRCLLDVARVPFFPALHHAGGETPAPGLVTAVVRDWLAREILLGHEWVSIPRSRVLQTPEVPGDLCSHAGDRSHARQPTGVSRLVSLGVCCAAVPPHGHQTMPGSLFFLPSSRSPAGCPGPRSQGLLSSMFLRFVRDSIPVICFRSAANLGTAETRGGVILLRRTAAAQADLFCRDPLNLLLNRCRGSPREKQERDP